MHTIQDGCRALNPLRILCSSTRQWNPGDEWIALGIRRLFHTLYPGRILNWILYDRSPDCFEKPWSAPDRKPLLLGNSYQPGEQLPPVDLLVVAGTPEWLGPHLEPLARIRPTSAAPVFYLGIDYPSAELPLSPFDRKMLSQSLVVARGPMARQALEGLGIQAHLLPCPALFSAFIEYPARTLRRIGLVLQSDRVANQSVSLELKSRMLTLVSQLRERYFVKVICNYIDEFFDFSATAECPVCYSYDSNDYFAYLADCDLVISTRLHSAIIANSLLKPAILTNAEPRATSAVELLPYVIVCEPEAVPGTLEQFDIDPAVRNLFNWKRAQETRYLDLLRGALQEHGLY